MSLRETDKISLSFLSDSIWALISFRFSKRPATHFLSALSSASYFMSRALRLSLSCFVRSIIFSKLFIMFSFSRSTSSIFCFNCIVVFFTSSKFCIKLFFSLISRFSLNSKLFTSCSRELSFFWIASSDLWVSHKLASLAEEETFKFSISCNRKSFETLAEVRVVWSSEISATLSFNSSLKDEIFCERLSFSPLRFTT